VRSGAVVAVGCCGAALLAGPAPAVAAPACGGEWAAASVLGPPAADLAWRAHLRGRTPLWTGPERGRRPRGTVTPRQAPWLLVLGSAPDLAGRCWLRVRLPSRPNRAAAWINASRTRLRATRWRIVVTRRARTLDVYASGRRLRSFKVVVGHPATPSPRGLFSITGVWRWKADDFLGAYVVPLTAHSNVLQEFGGGDGRVGLHGRGGASLRDPLGSARSHGCIRLTNRAISWIVRTVGADALPGVPVRVR
jgi:hypothetical protein